MDARALRTVAVLTGGDLAHSKRRFHRSGRGAVRGALGEYLQPLGDIARLVDRLYHRKKARREGSFMDGRRGSSAKVEEEAKGEGQSLLDLDVCPSSFSRRYPLFLCGTVDDDAAILPYRRFSCSLHRDRRHLLFLRFNSVQRAVGDSRMAGFRRMLGDNFRLDL